MDHAEILNRLLSKACPSYAVGNGYNVYSIDLHCVDIIIVAKKTGSIEKDGEYDYSTYHVKETSLTPQPASNK